MGSLLAVIALVVSGCASRRDGSAPANTMPNRVPQTGANVDATPNLAPPVAISLPPRHGRFSYQIGGAYRAASKVAIVDRDHTSPPDPTAFSICYINAYQAQPDAVSWWTHRRPDLLLRNAAGELIIDKQWDEPLLDISTSTRRTALLAVVGAWIDDCAARGYRAVEADNLDSYSRSQGLLTVDQALTYGRLLTTRAHRDHLAIAQKNAADLSTQARRAGFDFAIAEECQVYAECDTYIAVYGAELFEIEYADQSASAFTTACRMRGKNVSIVLRDRDVTPPTDAHHIERWCP